MLIDRTHGPEESPLRVQGVPKEGIITIRSLSPEYDGCFTHYTKDGSRYCNPHGCARCRKGEKKQWKGYFAAESFEPHDEMWHPICFEMTEACELLMRGVYARGQVWTLRRVLTEGEKGKKVEGMLLDQLDPSKLPQPFDFLACLKHCYYVFEIELGVKNPLPPRIMLPRSAGAAPRNYRAPQAEQEAFDPQEVLKRLEEARSRFPAASRNGKK